MVMKRTLRSRRESVRGPVSGPTAGGDARRQPPRYDDHEMAAAGHTKTHVAPAGPGRSLLSLDPELGQLLTPDRREAAERELHVRVTSFPLGEWDGARLADADP